MCPDLAMAVPKGGADPGRPRPVSPTGLHMAGPWELQYPIMGHTGNGAERRRPFPMYHVRRWPSTRSPGQWTAVAAGAALLRPEW